MPVPSCLPYEKDLHVSPRYKLPRLSKRDAANQAERRNEHDAEPKRFGPHGSNIFRHRLEAKLDDAHNETRRNGEGPDVYGVRTNSIVRRTETILNHVVTM